jgi:ferrochelatase
VTKHKTGVLVMSYGTPENMDQVESYYTHIRRGRPPAPEQLRDLIARYEAIGGVFPLRDNTNRQVAALEQLLNERYGDRTEFVCYQGLKHAAPYIEDGIDAMVRDGIREAVGIVLAPHYSVMSVGSYIERARQRAETAGLHLSFVKSYHLHPQLIEALAARVKAGLEQFDVPAAEVRVFFSAHSLPVRVLEMNDPYVDQLMETSKAVADKAGVDQWQFVWQSAGATPEPWLGPDVLDALRTVKEEAQTAHVLICPLGFVSDHLEILYDLDIEAQNTARSLGIRLVRTESLNTDPLYIETLADQVISKFEEGGGHE